MSHLKMFKNIVSASQAYAISLFKYIKRKILKYKANVFLTNSVI
jgi:hypothetical protein